MEDLMTVIKECNSNIADFKDTMNKAVGVAASDKELEDIALSYFDTYYQRVKDQVESIAYFIKLCRLDNQYGFMGGGMINKEGNTTIKIG